MNRISFRDNNYEKKKSIKDAKSAQNAVISTV